MYCTKEICRRGSVQASYTVEASYVMTIVILALTLLIQTAYSRCCEETGIMRLHHRVELLRSCEIEAQQAVFLQPWEEQGSESWIADMEGTFSSQTWSGEVLREEQKIQGNACGDGWQKEITAQIHAPENQMRMLTIFDSAAERVGTGVDIGETAGGGVDYGGT